jgi:hypothetical protein
VDDLKKLNKNKKLVKKLAKKYDAFLASGTLIKQIPRLLGPGLNRAGKFPALVGPNDSLTDKVEEARAQVKFALKKVLCMSTAVANVTMSKEEISRNIMLSVNFLVSLLKKVSNSGSGKQPRVPEGTRGADAHERPCCRAGVCALVVTSHDAHLPAPPLPSPLLPHPPTTWRCRTGRTSARCTSSPRWARRSRSTSKRGRCAGSAAVVAQPSGGGGAVAAAGLGCERSYSLSQTLLRCNHTAGKRLLRVTSTPLVDLALKQ